MKCNFIFKNGIVLKSEGKIHKGLFNNPDLAIVKVDSGNYLINLNLIGNDRLIFYKKNDDYFLGKQRKVRWKNMKTIIRFNDQEVKWECNSCLPGFTIVNKDNLVTK